MPWIAAVVPERSTYIFRTIINTNIDWFSTPLNDAIKRANDPQYGYGDINLNT